MLDSKFNPATIESKHYEAMEKSGAFACDVSSSAQPFTVMMPPPNVTGSLHMGHALNMTLQDILTRFYRMKGRDALWQPGTDHAGIATQMVVERMLDQEGKHRRDLGREAFLERVWKWKAESGGTIVGQLRRLGATPDWSRERFTMDEGLSKAVLKVFVQLYKEKLIYRDKRLVNWDPKLLTSISDLEVEQREQKGHMWHIRYPLADVDAGVEYITVATTRPETMLGDTAVAVHPEDERYKDLIGKMVALPITGRLIPIVADEYSDPEKGSGAVKITPAHDFNDFEVGKRHDLPMINVFDVHAAILPLDDIPSKYHGLDRYKARELILQELEEMELLAEVEDIKNSLPYGDRSGVVIEPYLTDQWYVDAHTMAQPAIKAVREGKTRFVPQTWENTYFQWMENIQPWCISRQLWWGHQIPAWYGPDGRVFVAETEDEAYKEADAHYGESVTLRRDDDVLDTWFSSALWPFSTLGWPDESAKPMLAKYYPGDVLITGFDIIFFWVARMMMMGIHFMGDVPFKDVYMHALVRDAKGQKMSKSKGNVMDPLDLIDKFGADALRFTMTAMAAQGRDIKLSEDRVEGYRNFATKLWNAARYAEMNSCTFNPDFKPEAVTSTLNKWIVGELAACSEAIEKALGEYKFNEAASAIYQFVWGTLCDWYLEFSKPLLQGEGVDAAARVEVQNTTAWVINQVLLLLNPIMPFITEELAETYGGKGQGLVMQQSWPEYAPALQNKDAQDEIQWLCGLITEIRSVRSDMNVPAGAKIELMVKDASAVTKARLNTYQEIIQRLARLNTITDTDNVPKGAIQSVHGEATIILPIAELIDLDAERERLKKQIVKLEQEIEKVDRNLANENFVKNAPDEIIEEQKQRREDAQAAHIKLSAALKQLEAA
ncbi:MAG: valine--tRNA ligase [Alphaproteobacteria bacterium]|nr:valine--tRNA ligase [Alphaproteobacteria bacterium]MCD8570573.1 valine--tRNA ligase [Alphaproteobacteria bacterium]